MTRYDEEFLGHLKDTANLFCSVLPWKWYAVLFVPVCIAYFIGSGFLFALLFVLGCFICRSAKLGGLVGWFIVSVTVFLFFFFPEQGHFIDSVLRMPARGALRSEIMSSADVMSRIPKTFSRRLFAALISGLWVGGTIGLGVGMVGKKIFGKNSSVL
jgi:hypothetical protein